MSFSNVRPAWVIVGDGVIRQYKEGRMDLERALKKLDDIGAPESMRNRLYEEVEDKAGD